MSDTPTPVERFDLLIVSLDRTFSTVEHGTKALVNYLLASNIIRLTDEAIAQEWTELYGGPGPTAHEAFTRGAFDSDLAPYIEVAIRTGKRYIPMPYGGGKDEQVRFFIEFRGVLWKDLAPQFKNRLARLLTTRLDIRTRPHEALTPHREVGADELPEDVKFARKDRASPRVGTTVEEF